MRGKVQRCKISLPLEPGQLPFGVAPRRLLDFRDALGLRNFAREERLDLAQAEGRCRGRSDIFLRANFFDNARLEHFLDAPINAGIEVRSFPIKKHALCCSTGILPVGRIGNLPVRQISGQDARWPHRQDACATKLRRKRFASQQADFHRAN